SHTCEVQSFLVLGVRSSEFGVRSSEFGGSILGVPHESEKRYSLWLNYEIHFCGIDTEYA
ncbi:hypothetical protein, partial [Crocosphaera sp.]|uniref:hypothetical protein n=1 Tax=Crocosphaera sp. TaxID=2729996 RepID=UPI00257B910D